VVCIGSQRRRGGHDSIALLNTGVPRHPPRDVAEQGVADPQRPSDRGQSIAEQQTESPRRGDPLRHPDGVRTCLRVFTFGDGVVVDDVVDAPKESPAAASGWRRCNSASHSARGSPLSRRRMKNWTSQRITVRVAWSTTAQATRGPHCATRYRTARTPSSTRSAASSPNLRCGRCAAAAGSSRSATRPA
jgi:hypothetical protein